MKEKFPIFAKKKEGVDLIYLDSAATTHKPQIVIDTITNFYSNEYATVHRGLYKQALDVTNRLEKVRSQVADFICCNKEEVIFTHSATESLNLIAYSYGEKNIREGDEILVSIEEHHSNYLPWKLLCDRKKGRFITFTDLNDFKKKLTRRTKIVAITHQSNVLGRINPIKEIARLAHAFSAVVVVDGAQMVAHDRVNVKDLDVDFYAFSGHKMYGPTGVGVLFGKYLLLEQMDPFHGGGAMVERIEEEIVFRLPPHKFEAGTPMIASILGLGAAIDFINDVGFEVIKEHEHALSCELYDLLEGKVKFLNPHCRGFSILTFTTESLHPIDIATLLSLDNISVRAGNMCAQPLLNSLGLDSVLRVSLGIYNNFKDIEKFAFALFDLQKKSSAISCRAFVNSSISTTL